MKSKEPAAAKSKNPDALKGVKHIESEKLLHDVTLSPYEHFTPPDAPHSLVIKIFNSDPNRSYIIRVSVLEDSVTLPKHKEVK